MSSYIISSPAKGVKNSESQRDVSEPNVVTPSNVGQSVQAYGTEVIKSGDEERENLPLQS
ncbi:hypothetical protein CASFOL_040304 [Castilleja foliolosa]|uniref:Uncharacterized protein n=1 Tax=Castilleja foliolosa TaxID=1961234 RepID=A0ABD3BF28_9LAMI